MIRGMNFSPNQASQELYLTSKTEATIHRILPATLVFVITMNFEFKHPWQANLPSSSLRATLKK